jgi:hypothetical protein
MIPKVCLRKTNIYDGLPKLLLSINSSILYTFFHLPITLPIFVSILFYFVHVENIYASFRKYNFHGGLVVIQQLTKLSAYYHTHPPIHTPWFLHFEPFTCVDFLTSSFSKESLYVLNSGIFFSENVTCFFQTWTTSSNDMIPFSHHQFLHVLI